MATRKRKTTKKKTPISLNGTIAGTAIGIICIAMALFSCFLIFKGSSLHNDNLSATLGVLGAFIYKGIRTLTGQCEIFVPILLLLIGLHFVAPRLNINNRIIGSTTVVLISLLAMVHLRIDASVAVSQGLDGFGGGVLGGIIAVLLVRSVSKVGAVIVLVAVILIAIYIGSNRAVVKWLQSFFGHAAPAVANGSDGLRDLLFTKQVDDESVEKTSIRKRKERAANLVVKDEAPDKEKPKNKKSSFGNKLNVNKELAVISDETNNTESLMNNLKEYHDELVEADERSKVEQFISSGEHEKTDVSIELKHAEYSLPNMNILEEPEKKLQTNTSEIEDNAQVLLDTLNNFGVKGDINDVNVGPTITQYEFKPASGVRVTRIVNLADDLALNLAVTGLRIEAPIPNKSAVGIEVPNKQPRTVRIKEVINSEEFQESSSSLTFALGKDISGHPVVADLAKMPHLLIAGATGSGKSVCLNALITSILFKAKPSEVKFLMIDPKKVELSNYSHIPHLLTPVVTDAKKAAATLKWVVKEMERRYEIFAETGSRDIKTYNQKYMKAEVSGDEINSLIFMPQIVVIIDELADLMMVAPGDVEDSICRLAQLARAAGIHLVIATQRPSVDIITGLIKANIPSRIAFGVSSQVDSRTILDMGGAEKLLGNGDMLYYPRGYAKPVRVQGVYVSDKEIDDVVGFVKRQATPVYDESMDENIESLLTPESTSNVTSQEPSNDPLLGEACMFFIENGNASISMLQRHYRIGYTRAARIIDELENLGFVGPYEGSKARKIKISLEECAEFFKL